MSKFCTNCGATLEVTQKFCTECGAKVFNQESNPQDSKNKKSNNDFLPNSLVKEKANENNSNTFNGDNKDTSTSNLYKNGMDIIISSSILYSTPFLFAGKQIIAQFESLKDKSPEDLSSDQIKNIQLENFLADFYKYSNAFVERVTQYFSDIIRKNTQRNDIKEKTSEFISDEIRKESFKKFDEVFLKYTATMQELGVQLESVSSIKSAIQGTFVGGGLQMLGSKGKSSGAGMVAGALIGAALAEAEKIQLREKLLKAAFDGIKETIETLPICNQKLMDQYSSYIYGSNIDFNERDNQIERGKSILNEIKKHCSLILDNIVLGNSFWSNSILQINKAQKGYSFGKIYGYGIGIIFLIAAFIVIPNTEEDSVIRDITFSSMFILPLIAYLFYRFVIKENSVTEQKRKILAEITSNKSKFIQLENSLQSLNDYKNRLSFEFTK